MIKNILTYYFISFLFTIYDVLIVRKVDLALKDILVLSLIPGILISILLVYFIRKIIEDIKNKDYLVVFFTIIIGIIFTKYYFKL